MDKEEIILKTDSLGRVRTPVARKEALLAEYERSGLPASKFARMAGVNYQTFATWVQLPSMTIQQVASITPEAWAAMHRSNAKPTRPQQVAA